MSNYSSFVFEKYTFADKELTLTYSLDGSVVFNETYGFDFDYVDYDEACLTKAIEQLFFIAGVSYFKTYVPAKIVIKSGSITSAQAEFYAKTYQKGLGEFWYVNKLDPKTSIPFPANASKSIRCINENASGLLVGLGGGKDSIVSVELLKYLEIENVSTWSLNHENQLRPLVEKIGLTHYFVSRQIDEKLLNRDMLPNRFNGHVPISALFASVGVIVAILTGTQDVVTSNERSADEATLMYNDVAVNHQYSKTSEFESDFQNQLLMNFGDSIRFYSLLRPLSEVQIAKIFMNFGYKKYRDVFSSCNRAFVHGETQLSWDGTCPKCAFVFMLLASFGDEQDLEKLFDTNPLTNPELEETYRNLLGISGDKPLECVGEVAESRWAMDRMKQSHPDLEKYRYQSPTDAEIFRLSEHFMPESLSQKIIPVFEQLGLQP